ncbi:MAG TPA: hypothetical protein VHV10_02905 [Ktedonobacteraceae bacterium]|nr:hypothetical protein [Ktedonobacteraceae bacterium]
MQIEQIIQQAKDHILEHGRHIPEIIIELDTQEMCIFASPDIVNSDSSLEKQHRFFTAGRLLGRSKPKANITYIAFIVEVFGSFNRNIDRPSLDPERKECLSIVTLDVIKEDDKKCIEQHMHIYELIRDGSGKLVDLLNMHFEDGEVHSPLLIAFMAGFGSSKMSEEQRNDAIAKKMGPDATGEDIREMSKQIFEREAYIKGPLTTNIPRKRSTMSYKRTKKKRKS